MKKSLLFSAVLAGLMLGSCSSSDDLAGGNTSANQDGKGYVAFNINLPTQSGSSSRAGGSENDQFDAGMQSEYDVKNATLLLFQGDDEATATFSKAYALNTSPWTDKNKTDNVTSTSAKIVQQVDAPTNKYFALVVLNHNSVFTLGTGGTVTVGAENLSRKTLKQFLEMTTPTSGKTLTENGFYMANAPLASKPGGSTPPTGAIVNTLVSLDGKVKATETEASASPANIYVERGVAKVTMQASTVPEVTGSYTDAAQTKKVPFKVTSWALDNTNKSTYLVRSTEGFSDWLELASKESSVTNKYRFVGSNEVASNLYRTYFAKDPNFDTAGHASVTFNKAADADYSTEFGDEKPKYCFENTFDVDNQNDNKTTRVLIKAKLNNGTTFYVLNGNENLIYTEGDVIKEIKKQFLTEYTQWIKDNVTSPTSVGESNVDVTISTDPGDVSITKIELTGVTYKTGYTPLTTSDVVAKVKERLGSIEKYKDGESYYFVRIKHFGDDLTPWENGKLGVGNGKVYPDSDKNDNWLGRYGVLRNNWYDIKVTAVKGLGSAKVPDLTTDTDDELKSYIAVQINVLSWAKRTQGAVLH